MTNHGVKITYSGDQPFLLKLIMGVPKDDYNEFPSKLPMYLSDNSNLTSSTVHEITKKRTDISMPFRTNIPKTSLTYFEDVRSICPDATHAIIRCVEGDLKKWADKIIGYKKSETLQMEALFRLERNLTEREVKLPCFKFTIVNKKCCAISLSGRESSTAIAETDEIEKSGKVTSDLFSGVWTDAELLAGDNQKNCCVKVLRELHPNLFKHVHPSAKGDDTKRYMSMLDAAELWRRSLNAMSLLLRQSEETFKSDLYKHWAETYFQISLAIFSLDIAITPYKLKLLLIPQLVESGYIESPWNHMTESLEKSNHDAQKDYHMR